MCVLLVVRLDQRGLCGGASVTAVSEPAELGAHTALCLLGPGPLSAGQWDLITGQ